MIGKLMYFACIIICFFFSYESFKEKKIKKAVLEIIGGLFFLFLFLRTYDVF